MSEAARAAVYLHDDQTLAQAECVRARRIENLGDLVHLDEVIARAERAQLIAAARLRVRAHFVCARAGHRAVLLGHVEVFFARHDAPQRPQRALLQHLVQLRFVQVHVVLAADPARTILIQGGGQVAQVRLHFVLV